MKLFFVLLFTVACNFYFEAATKETLEILILFHHWNIATLIL